LGFVCTPIAIPVTFTENVHEVPAASVPPPLRGASGCVTARTTAGVKRESFSRRFGSAVRTRTYDPQVNNRPFNITFSGASTLKRRPWSSSCC